MVDFQSRETDRGRTTIDGGGDDPSSDATTANEPTDDGTGGNERTDDTSPATSSNVAAAVVTVSATRTHENDPGGDAVVDALEAAGHDVVTREVLRTAHDSVQQSIDTLTNRDDVTVVVTTGGTGVSPRDVTVDAVSPLIDKDLPGFGELFRRRYAEEVGSDAIATRTTAGIIETTPVFCLPGDAEGARVGVSEIVVEQAERLAELAAGDEATDP